MIAPATLKKHAMYAAYDYAYLRKKGYTNAEIKAFWDRDAAQGCAPIVKAPQIPDYVCYYQPTAH